jgi:protein required for attachment to host cells
MLIAEPRFFGRLREKLRHFITREVARHLTTAAAANCAGDLFPAR